MNRIPSLPSPITEDSAIAWFRAMEELNLDFHPEDEPRGIVFMNAAGHLVPLFNDDECEALANILERMCEELPDPAETALRAWRA